MNETAAPKDTKPGEGATAKRWFERIGPEALVIWLGAAWLLLVVLQGMAAASGLAWLIVDYRLAAQFGDALGSLAAFMAALAAVGAWRAVRFQQQELLGRESELREQQAHAALTAFETNFFRLMDALSRLVEATDIKPTAATMARVRQKGREVNEVDIQRGKDAFRRIARTLINFVAEDNPDYAVTPIEAWEKTYNLYKDDLGHYFRTLYYIVRYAKNNCPSDPKFYTNIVRAQLSNSELILLGFNCTFGYGRKRFKPLVEEFEFFDNLDLSDLPGVYEILAEELQASAFGPADDDKPAYRRGVGDGQSMQAT